VTLATPDAPLVEVGSMTDETLNRAGTRSWRRERSPGENVFSYLMNNYWHTNYKADQEGSFTFRYAISTHAAFDAGRAARFGMEASQPLIALPSARNAAIRRPLCTVRAHSTIITRLRPAADGRGWVVNLWNAGETKDTVQVDWTGGQKVTWYSSNLREQRIFAAPFPIVLPPFGTALLRAEP
jgi:alpha-mannosidase